MIVISPLAVRANPDARYSLPSWPKSNLHDEDYPGLQYCSTASSRLVDEATIVRLPRNRMLAKRENPTLIQSWLTGLNPELRDRVPLRLMRENDLETVAPEIMGAARAFLAGG